MRKESGGEYPECKPSQGWANEWTRCGMLSGLAINGHIAGGCHQAVFFLVLGLWFLAFALLALGFWLG
jgi:hypothetical protein